MKWLKNKGLFSKLRNNSGIIIIVVMWVVVILSTLVISLSRKTNIELSLTKYSLAKQKAHYLAWAAFLQAVRMVQLDSQDADSAQDDNLYYCGVPKKEDLALEDMFKDQPLGSGHFSVEYEYLESGAQEGKLVYGMQDEERKINLNAIVAQNHTILVALLSIVGVGEEDAKVIVFSLIDWVDEDAVVSQEPYGAENEYYESLPQAYRPKNRPLESFAELKLVRGMTKEIAQKLKPHVTIFPQEGGELKVNFNTASLSVLQAMGRAFTGPATHTDSSDADSLALKIIEYRSGEDRIEFTKDDLFIDIAAMALNAKERILGLVMNQYRTRISDYLRIRAVGVEDDRGISSSIDAVLRREDLAIVYWKRE